jgi:hypothetical protein
MRWPKFDGKYEILLTPDGGSRSGLVAPNAKRLSLIKFFTAQINNDDTRSTYLIAHLWRLR